MTYRFRDFFKSKNLQKLEGQFLPKLGGPCGHRSVHSRSKTLKTKRAKIQKKKNSCLTEASTKTPMVVWGNGGTSEIWVKDGWYALLEKQVVSRSSRPSLALALSGPKGPLGG